jgi:hypothetical protein
MDLLQKKEHKEMNEYLYENGSPNGETLDEEEIIYMVANEKVHTNRKKKYHKEKSHEIGVTNNFTHQNYRIIR